MNPDFAALYSRIAESVVRALPDEWTTAQIRAYFYADSITWETEYVASGGELRDFGISMETTRAFRDLRRQHRESGQKVWGQVTFNLSSGGKFHLTYGYEDCDDNGDTIWDEAKWRRRYDERQERLSGQ